MQQAMKAPPSLSEKPLMRLVNWGLRHSGLVFKLLSLLGCLGLLALPLFERKVKFDEKTLMLGNARTNVEYRSDPQWCASGGCLGKPNADIISMAQSFEQHVHGLQHVVQHSHFPGSVTASAYADNAEEYGVYASSEDDPADLLELVERFMRHELKLEVHRSHAGGNCTSLHGVFRAPLADGKESILVATPAALTPGTGFGDAPPAGAPLLLSAAALFMGHLRYSPYATWPAKDVVWIVPDVGCEGSSLAALERWAKSYQAEPGVTPSAAQASASAFVRAGVMQQAIVLQADQSDPSQLEVLIEGYDGQLPKLDMYYMLRMAAKHASGVRVKPRAEHAQPRSLMHALLGRIKNNKIRVHIQKVVNILQFTARQAMGTPTGPHAAFKEFIVDAATAKFGGSDPLPNGQIPRKLPPRALTLIPKVASYLEAMVRSLNNLDERFHHSYFLYLLTSPDTFVTVEIYIVPLVALIAALMVKAAGLRNSLRTAAPTPPGPQQQQQQQQQQVQQQEQQQEGTAPQTAQAEGPEASHSQESASQGTQATRLAYSGALEPALPDQAQGVWGHAVAAVALLLGVCVGCGAGLRYALCSWGCKGGLLQQSQQSQQLQQQGGGSGMGGLGGDHMGWDQGAWPVISLPGWAGGRQLGLQEQATLLACLVVLLATLGSDVSRLAFSTGCDSSDKKHQHEQHEQHEQQHEQQQREGSGVLSTEGECGRSGGGGRTGRGEGQGEQGQGVHIGCTQVEAKTELGPRERWCMAVRVVMLSCVCMVLAALASMNWALGYVLAGLLVPVVALRGQSLRPYTGRAKFARIAALLLASPLMVACVLGLLVAVDMHNAWNRQLPLGKVLNPAVLRACAQELVCGSRYMTYIMFWAALLPCWLVELGTLVWE